MKKYLAATAIMLALATAACQKKAEDAAAPAGNSVTPVGTATPNNGQDWTLTMAKTPEGGFRMGNPDAPVKLVEYASITCPHCRDFTKAAGEPLRNEFVKSGKVSWEYRNFVLNPLDVAATLVARCQGPDPFFAMVDQLYASQVQWIGKFNSIDEAKLRQLGALPQGEQFQQLVTLSGLDEFFKTHGVPADKINGCLTDKKALDELLKIRDYGVNTDKVDGTPSFFINGVKQDNVYDWPGLEPKLRAAAK